MSNQKAILDKKLTLTQTNPYVVSHKAYDSGPLGFSSSTGFQFYEVKENDARFSKNFKTANPDDYDLSTTKKAKVIKKIEYSGGYRVPKESLDKPYMKNKCWKSNDDQDDNEKYSKEQIMKKLGLEIPNQQLNSSKKRKQSRSRSRSLGTIQEKNRQNIANLSSQALVNEAEKKINNIHQRREEQNQRQKREEELRKKGQKLILQNEETHEEVYVTVDSHKIKMIQTYIKQLELQEQLDNIQRLKSENLYNKSPSKMKKELTLQDKMKKEFTLKEIQNEIKYVELIRNHEIYKLEKEKIGQIAKVYFDLNKKDFDLNQFLSPNTERWGKSPVVTIAKNEQNPFNHLLFSREAYILLVDRIVKELQDLQKKSEMFNSLNQSKDRKIESIDSAIIDKFLSQSKNVKEILNIQNDQVSKIIQRKETVPVQDIKNQLINIANIQINERNQIINKIEQQYNEKMKILREEFEIQEKIKELNQELEAIKQENEEQGIENLKEEQIEKILEMEENHLGGYDSDPEALTLQQRTIMICKQKRELQKEVLQRIQERCKSADKVRLTLPIPQEFEERARQSKFKKSIRQTKLEEMIKELQEKDKSIYGYIFKPKEIPESVKIPNLFEQIMEENQKRREIVRQTSQQMTLQNEKPFSFYYRDMDKEKVYKRPYWERQNFVFRANAIPKHVTQKRLEKMKKLQEEKRKQRVQKRKEELIRMSSLPPRMAKHEEEKKQKLLQDVDEYDEEGIPIFKQQSSGKYFKYTFEPPRAKKIPDFHKLHKTFQQELDVKKASFKPTIIEPFDFEESRKLPNRDYLDQENMLIRATLDKFYQHKSENIQKITYIDPDNLPPSTKKSQEIIKFRKKQEQIKRKKEKEQQEELNAREKKREELKKRFYASDALKNFQEEREQQKLEKEIEKQKQIEYEKQMNEEFHNKIKEKLDAKPLLIEKYDKDQSAIEKVKEKWTYKNSQHSKYSQQY
ncbi:hypothetical protein ABPG72_016373 [Tetrahymena utriculariae]